MPQLVAKRPLPGTARPYSFPEFKRTRLANKVEVLAVNVADRPVAAAQLILNAGAENDPIDESGVASLTARALTEGTQRYEGAEFADAAERIGADIRASVDWDSFEASVRVPMTRMEPALELLAEAALRPTFPEREVERLKQERLNELMQEFADPSARAEHAFRGAVYTPDSRYSRPLGGTLDTAGTLDRSKVSSYYARLATPGSATLIVAGDLEGFPLAKTVDSLFAEWGADEPKRTSLTVEEAVKETTVTLVNRPGSVQSHLIIGHVGVPRLTPDYFPLALGITALGGTFNSRLNMKLREEKGYTYGCRGVFAFRRHAGPFQAAAAVQTEVTVDATGDILEVLRVTCRDGLTDQEIEDARDFLVGIFPLRFETPDAIADALSDMVAYGLPDDYFTTYRQSMEAVTSDEVNESLQQRIHPDRLAIVVVGDAEKVADPLEKAGFGRVAVVEDPPLQNR